MALDNASYRLERLKALASIASSLAIPIIIALFGYIVQITISSDGVKKDYVQIATSILKEAPNSQNLELRAWAIKILDKYSEIPLSDKASNSLKNRVSIYSGFDFIPNPPSMCMAPPKENKIIELVEKNTDGRVLDEDDLKVFIAQILDESLKADTNTIYLKCLQDYVRVIKG